MTFFWIDDVWVTGYLAQHLGIEHQDCIQHWTMKRDQLLLHKVDISALDISTYISTIYLHQALQHPDNYLPDYISGPMDRDRALNMALHTRAK